MIPAETHRPSYMLLGIQASCREGEQKRGEGSGHMESKKNIRNENVGYHHAREDPSPIKGLTRHTKMHPKHVNMLIQVENIDWPLS